MADLPIIFSAPMVQALLDGRKTQTRRLAPVPRFDAEGCINASLGGRNDWWDYWSQDRAEVHRFRLPYAPGDRLWVREAYAFPENLLDGLVTYRATDDWPLTRAGWRPSIHMPRWASRLTLTVTDVRVQRLQEISHQDAIHEGVQCHTCTAMQQSACYGKGCPAARATFGTLWNSLHGPDAWDANPWVAAISFEVECANIDQARSPHA